MSTENSDKYGFKCKTNLKKAIEITFRWYEKNKDKLSKSFKYNSFTEKN